MIQKYPKYLKSGMKFGKLTVLGVDESYDLSNARPSIWKYVCKCECGTVKSVSRDPLVRGKVLSCGCLLCKGKKRLSVGDKFGKLTIIGLPDDTKSPSTQKYLCKCECGNTVFVMKSRLERGVTKSCGCLRVILSKSNIKVNRIQEVGDIVRIYFFNSKEEFAIIDKVDYDQVKGFCWYINKGKYVSYAESHIREVGKTASMHRVLLGNPDCVVDHIDGNGLNNRRDNLRKCDYSKNAQNRRISDANSTGVVGVYWDKRSAKWTAGITYQGEVHYLGIFTEFDAAVKVRKEAEEYYFGEYSHDNSRGRNDVIQ